MKKKGILAFLLCFMMLFFVGCGNGGPSGGGGSDDPDSGIENPDEEEVRHRADEMETLTSADFWPFPTYFELLYNV